MEMLARVEPELDRSVRKMAAGARSFTPGPVRQVRAAGRARMAQRLLGSVAGGVAVAAAAVLAARVMSPLTSLLVAVVVVGASIAVWARVDAVLEDGILESLSPALQRKLTAVNLLSWIRDDSLSKALAPYLPLLLPMSADETRAYLNAAPMDLRRRLLRPGLGHLLPAGLQTLVFGRRRLAATAFVTADAPTPRLVSPRREGDDGPVHAVADVVLTSHDTTASAQRHPPSHEPPRAGGEAAEWHRAAMSAILRQRVLLQFVAAFNAARLSQRNLSVAASVSGVALVAAVLWRLRSGRTTSAMPPRWLTVVTVASAVAWLLRRRADRALAACQVHTISDSVHAWTQMRSVVTRSVDGLLASPLLQRAMAPAADAAAPVSPGDVPNTAVAGPRHAAGVTATDAAPAHVARQLFASPAVAGVGAVAAGTNANVAWRSGHAGDTGGAMTPQGGPAGDAAGHNCDAGQPPTAGDAHARGGSPSDVDAAVHAHGDHSATVQPTPTAAHHVHMRDWSDRGAYERWMRGLWSGDEGAWRDVYEFVATNQASLLAVGLAAVSAVALSRGR